jgi:pSer/pThr/pTyr-binding forkhead associated (FHA) protein
MARLVLNCDGVDLVAHELAGDVITIGRAPLNHIVIDNPAVSAQHAILARVADSYRLKDLHSTNGTQINGVSITDAESKDGDKIRFGSVVAIFCGTLRKG